MLPGSLCCPGSIFYLGSLIIAQNKRTLQVPYGGQLADTMTNGLCVDDHLLGFSAKPYTVVGLKHYETRTRRTHIRGRIAVHAGKKKIKGKEADRLYMDVLLTGKENELAWHICRKATQKNSA